MTDYRPHLLIPETEVDHIPDNPTSRSEKRDTDRFEHGSKLSSGLQDIVAAYTKVQTADSLGDEDIRVFEVHLSEWEKFSNKVVREFIEKEGMTIKNVHDDRHATVVTTKSRFSTLQGRINSYKDGEKCDKKFEDIASFSFRDALEKQSPSILELFKQEIGDNTIDVEIREENLEAEIGSDGQLRAEKKLLRKITDFGGTISSQPYTLSDNTRIVRADVKLKDLKAISEDTIVCHVAPTAFYTTAPAFCIPAQNSITLNRNIDISSLPIVAVLDTGIDFPAELEPLILEHWVPAGVEPGDKVHGTNVASKVAFAEVGKQLSGGIMTPRTRIIDCNIRGLDPESKDPAMISNPTMIKRIREAVIRYKDITKIFNFSSASTEPIEGDKISNLGYELDVLALKYGVQFVIAAGNHELYKTQDTLQDILDDDDAKIAAPSDSMLNISVGAIVGQDHDNSLSKRYEVAPYSRIGPGFQGMRKPDIVALAGTLVKTGNAPPDDYSLMLGKGGQWAFEAGTSFAAPVVSGDLAQISTSVPDNDILLSKALLYHGARLPLDMSMQKVERDDAAFYGDLYGRGLSYPIESMFSTSSKVTFLHKGSLNRLDKQHVKFLMPGICQGLNMNKRNKKVRIVVTCVTQSPVDNAKGTDYLGAYVEANLHSINSKGKIECKNPSETDGRKKWDTCFHFDQEYSSFGPGDWEIWLQLHNRYDVDNEQDIEYAMAVTIEDLTDSMNLYDEIVAEAQNRFPAVQMVRVPVRI